MRPVHALALLTLALAACNAERTADTGADPTAGAVDAIEAIEPVTEPTPMGHEYVGIVEEVGSQVKHIRPGQFVVGSFWASDNTCPICQAGY